MDIEVRDTNGHVLDIYNSRIENDTIILIVDSCELCMEDEWNKGNDRGIKTGYAEGYEKGREDGYERAREDYDEESC